MNFKVKIFFYLFILFGLEIRSIGKKYILAGSILAFVGINIYNKIQFDKRYDLKDKYEYEKLSRNRFISFEDQGLMNKNRIDISLSLFLKKQRNFLKMNNVILENLNNFNKKLLKVKNKTEEEIKNVEKFNFFQKYLNFHIKIRDFSFLENCKKEIDKHIEELIKNKEIYKSNLAEFEANLDKYEKEELNFDNKENEEKISKLQYEINENLLKNNENKIKNYQKEIENDEIKIKDFEEIINKFESEITSYQEKSKKNENEIINYKKVIERGEMEIKAYEEIAQSQKESLDCMKTLCENICKNTNYLSLKEQTLNGQMESESSYNCKTDKILLMRNNLLQKKEEINSLNEEKEKINNSINKKKEQMKEIEILLMKNNLLQKKEKLNSLNKEEEEIYRKINEKKEEIEEIKKVSIEQKEKAQKGKENEIKDYKEKLEELKIKILIDNC